MMPVVSTAGKTGASLFVFKGKNTPYRNVLRGGKVFIDPYASLFPRVDVVAVREQHGSVDSTNFSNEP